MSEGMPADVEAAEIALAVPAFIAASVVEGAEAVKAKAVIAADDVKAILEEHAHDFIGRAFQIVSALKALVAEAEKAV